VIRSTRQPLRARDERLLEHVVVRGLSWSDLTIGANSLMIPSLTPRPAAAKRDVQQPAADTPRQRHPHTVAST
jgi:hypothetical protein